MAHARRKLLEVFELSRSEIAGQAVALTAKLYEIERGVKDLGNEDRLLALQRRSKPVAYELHIWLTTQAWRWTGQIPRPAQSTIQRAIGLR